MNTSVECNCKVPSPIDWIDSATNLLQTLFQVLMLAMTIILLVFSRLIRSKQNSSETRILTTLSEFRQALNE